MDITGGRACGRGSFANLSESSRSYLSQMLEPPRESLPVSRTTLDDRLSYSGTIDKNS